MQGNAWYFMFVCLQLPATEVGALSGLLHSLHLSHEHPVNAHRNQLVSINSHCVYSPQSFQTNMLALTCLSVVH